MMANRAPAAKRLALIMSTEVGLRTQYLNWREHFPDDLGIEPVWIVMDFWKDGGMVERLPLPRTIRGRIRGQLEVADALRQGPFDGIFVAVHSALALFSNELDRTPCFMTFDVTPKQLHDFGPIYNKAPSRFKAVESFKHKRRELAYRKCRLLFPWSNWAGESAVRDYGATRATSHVIPPGVDLNRWAPGDRFDRTPKRVCELLFVGGDFERKGGELVLEWARGSGNAEFVLHVVTRKRLDNLGDARVRVYNDLTPNDPQLVELYSRADVFVLPTLADCYSLAGIEALASGLPVILGKTGGTGDVLRHGETGYLIAPNDVSSLASALDTLIADADLRYRMGKAARADAVLRYDAGRNIRQTVELMRAFL
jgi:glycosyltransferase involved in cell wall biosynthesis